MTNHPQAALISAVVTAFDGAGDLDLGANKEIYEWLAGYEVDGAFVAGTTGEFVTLTDTERLDVCAVAGTAFGPDRTYWHVGAASSRHAATLTARAVDRGARLLAAVTPYFMSASEQAVLDYYEAVVRAASGARVFAYLFASRTTTAVSPSLLARVSETGIAGVKISGEPHTRVRRYVEQLDSVGLPVYSGADGEFAEVLRAGGAGVISGVSTVLPQPFLELRAALRHGGDAEVDRATERARRAIEATRGGDLSRLKAVLDLRGLPGGPLRAPLDPPTAADRAELTALVADLL